MHFILPLIFYFVQVLIATLAASKTTSKDINDQLAQVCEGHCLESSSKIACRNVVLNEPLFSWQATETKTKIDSACEG